MEKFIVVGAPFEKFLELDHVIGVRDALQKVEDAVASEVAVGLILGQGLSLDELTRFREKKKILNIFINDHIYRCASSKYTHKQIAENNLITVPVRISDFEFKSSINIFKGCAEISDHATGYHVQGMVLLEASRQLFIAITEMYLVAEAELGNHYYIFDGINTEFYSFVFPIEIDVFYRISEQSTQGRKLSFVVEILFFQNSKDLVAKSICRFSVAEKSSINKLERRLAQQCINQRYLLNELTEANLARLGEVTA